MASPTRCSRSIGPDRGLAVAPAGERRAPRALQVHVAPPAVEVGRLAQQQGPAVAQARRCSPELVAGVGLATGRAPVGQRLPTSSDTPARVPQRRGVDAQLGGQLLVEHQQRGRRAGSAVHGTDRLGSSRAKESSSSNSVRAERRALRLRPEPGFGPPCRR